MAKQLVHIGVAVAIVGDGREYPAGSPPLGLVPGRSNVINIAACCGPNITFNENVIPQSGMYGTSAFWEKYPDVFTGLKHQPVPLADAMVKLRAWLKQFQGRLIACSSNVDFWHLLYSFFDTGRDCPFGSNGVIDTATVAMVKKGKRAPVPRTTEDSVVPIHVARSRWEMVTDGVMPRFGESPVPKQTRRNTVTAAQRLHDQRELDRILQEQRAARVRERGARLTGAGVTQWWRAPDLTAAQPAAPPLWQIPEPVPTELDELDE